MTRLEKIKAQQCTEALREARKWTGDGEYSDGLAREHWTPEYAAMVDKVDAALALNPDVGTK